MITMPVLNSANDIDIHSQEDDMSAYNGAYNSTYSSPTWLSVTENTRKNPGFEPDIQKGNYDATLNAATDIEIWGQVEDVSNDDDTTSSQVHLSNIKNLINNLTAEPNIQKGDKEKCNLVNDGTDIEVEVRCREEANNTANNSSSPVRLSNSEILIIALIGEPKIQKGNQEKANSVDDITDIEVEVLISILYTFFHVKMLQRYNYYYYISFVRLILDFFVCFVIVKHCTSS